ncbi:hypothetical protein AJ79_00866 [Helicocarpus griseus UAMH5409]|uniref:HNH nuclease domain-containing protein n=1 Tax=Helicocarpus griseus UAMH5409 TaxID=1447875 RepID=A0A2B7YBJ1_9EURO|nr:hypothetical protein AJ79_00866 [Helicocarpus griseus UAMH5409]
MFSSEATKAELPPPLDFSFHPLTPDDFLDLMSTSEREDIDAKKKQLQTFSFKDRHPTTGSQFINRKLTKLSVELEYIGSFKDALVKMRRMRLGVEMGVTRTVLHIKERMHLLESESVMLKRQRKFIAEDLDDEISHHYTFHVAYSSLRKSGVMRRSMDIGRDRFDYPAFKEEVTRYYEASRAGRNGSTKIWCHLLGCHLPANCVKAVQLVPKRMESEELAYSFGVGEMSPFNPRNGLTMYTLIWEALVSGNIMIVPVQPAQGKDIVWKCVVLNYPVGEQMLYDKVEWKDLNGRELKFLGRHRPATRFLFFRYLMTFLDHRYRETRLNMRLDQWKAPGSYIRQSMLTLLERKVSNGDHHDPTHFCEDTALEGWSGRKQPDEEEVLATSLWVRIMEEMQRARTNSRAVWEYDCIDLDNAQGSSSTSRNDGTDHAGDHAGDHVDDHVDDSNQWETYADTDSDSSDDSGYCSSDYEI